MAKNKEKEAEAVTEPVVSDSGREAAAHTKKIGEVPSMGRIVIFYQEKIGGMGQLESFPAIVLGDASKESNFKPEDIAIDIQVFRRARQGGNAEKQGVMYSETPTKNKWSWPVRK